MSFEVCLNQTSVAQRVLHYLLLFSGPEVQTSRAELSDHSIFSPSPRGGRMRVQDSGQKSFCAEGLDLPSAMK